MCPHHEAEGMGEMMREERISQVSEIRRQTHVKVSLQGQREAQSSKTLATQA